MKQVIGWYWKLASILGLFVLIGARCTLDRSGISATEWTTSATPDVICRNEPVVLAWDAGSIDAGAVIQISSSPDLFGSLFESTSARSETTVNPTEDTTFTFGISPGHFRVYEHRVDVRMDGEVRDERAFRFQGTCSGGVPGRKWVDLQGAYGECVAVGQVCSFSNPAPVRVTTISGLSALIAPSSCTMDLNGKPSDYSAELVPEPRASCSPTEETMRPADIELTFFMVCSDSLPGCLPPGAGGGMEPEPARFEPEPTSEPGACFDVCDPTRSDSCQGGLACLPRFEGSSEFICYNQSTCSPVTTQDPGVTGQPCACGDGVCEQARCNELQQTCPDDCGPSQPQQPPGQPAPICGDSACNGGETCWTCSQDCGPC